MANKKIWLGILVFCLFLAGCNDIVDGGDYTFEFKVQNNWSTPLIKVEFINGSNQSSPVLRTETLNISSGEMSGVYKVSGFSEKDGSGKRIYFVKLTYEGGTTQFVWGSRKDNSKLLVYNSQYVSNLSVTDGTW